MYGQWLKLYAPPHFEWPSVCERAVRVCERAVRSVYRAYLSGMFIRVCVCVSFPFSYEGEMWKLIVLVPNHCLSLFSIW